MSATDGIYRLSDGGEWNTLFMIKVLLAPFLLVYLLSIYLLAIWRWVKHERRRQVP